MVNGILFPSSLSFNAVSTHRCNSEWLLSKKVKYFQSAASLVIRAKDEISEFSNGRSITLSVSSFKLCEIIMVANVVQEGGYWMLDAGYWILDAGYWILDTGCWMLDAGYWILDTGYLVSSIYHSLQSTGSIPCLIRYSLVFEKCLHPKKPALAESGEGCADRRIKCLLSSIRVLFSCANFPHNKNTTCSFSSEIFLITVSVNCDQPIFE